MFCIRIADTVIGIQNQYQHVEQLCRAYWCDMDTPPLFTVCVSDEEVAQEQALATEAVSPGYAESVCIYRKICKQLPLLRQAFLFHSAVIEYEGRGYAFAASSGTGKSTHALLWHKHFGNDVHMVNGDKPICMFREDGALMAYGTPWCGKEGWSENKAVPLCGICFLERSENNSICRISPQEAVMYMLPQILLPKKMASLDALFALIEKTVEAVPCYRLKCNKNEEAAQIAYDGMNGGEGI